MTRGYKRMSSSDFEERKVDSSCLLLLFSLVMATCSNDVASATELTLLKQSGRLDTPFDFPLQAACFEDESNDLICLVRRSATIKSVTVVDSRTHRSQELVVQNAVGLVAITAVSKPKGFVVTDGTSLFVFRKRKLRDDLKLSTPMAAARLTASSSGLLACWSSSDFSSYVEIIDLERGVSIGSCGPIEGRVIDCRWTTKAGERRVLIVANKITEWSVQNGKCNSIAPYERLSSPTRICSTRSEAYSAVPAGDGLSSLMNFDIDEQDAHSILHRRWIGRFQLTKSDLKIVFLSELGLEVINSQTQKPIKQVALPSVGLGNLRNAELVVSEDASRAVVFGRFTRLLLCDLTTGQTTIPAGTHVDPVRILEWSRDDEHVLGGSSCVLKWSLSDNTTEELFRPKGEINRIDGLTVFDGGGLAISSFEADAQLWNRQAFLTLLDEDSRILFRNRQSNWPVLCVVASTNNVVQVASPDPDVVTTTDAVQDGLQFRTRTGKLLRSIRVGTGSLYGEIRLEGGNKFVAVQAITSSDETERIYVYRVANGESIGQLPGKNISTMSISHDEESLITGSLDGVVAIYDLPSLKRRKRFKAHINRVKDVSMTRDGKFVATSGRQENVIRIWNAVSGQPACKQVMVSEVETLKFSRTGRKLACGHRNGVVSIWRFTP